MDRKFEQAQKEYELKQDPFWDCDETITSYSFDIVVCGREDDLDEFARKLEAYAEELRKECNLELE